MSKKTYKRIKNFSTSITPEKTIAEIEKMLAAHGATKIMKEYDKEGNPINLAFMINTSKGELPIKLPMNLEGVISVFKKQGMGGRLPKSYWEKEDQARKTGWRILKDWLDSQLTLISLEMAKIEQIFLPYIYHMVEDKTMFEILEERGFNIPIEHKK